MRNPKNKIKTKNINSFKYKKNDAILNNFKDITEEKIDIALIIEQGHDIITINNIDEEKEYAIIKVYFK